MYNSSSVQYKDGSNVLYNSSSVQGQFQCIKVPVYKDGSNVLYNSSSVQEEFKGIKTIPGCKNSSSVDWQFHTKNVSV